MYLCTVGRTPHAIHHSTIININDSMRTLSYLRRILTLLLPVCAALSCTSCIITKVSGHDKSAKAADTFAQTADAFMRTDTTSVILATRYMPADGSRDVTDDIQRLIDSHPNRTIYFPDGVYKVSRPILTPADPKRSVMLELANYARLQATGDWAEGGAVVRLGASHPANDISTPGSNYGLRGGIIDGNNVADGVSVDGGRETVVQDVSIKHVRVGVHIKRGVNNGSSDADISGVNIVGNNTKSSVGVLVEGYDNTFTNMRIAAVNIGVRLKSGGNVLRNIHPLYINGPEQDYATTRGFVVEASGNWLDYCYSDTFATAFWLGKGVSVSMVNCYTMWYTGFDKPEVCIWCDGKFDSYVSGIRCDFAVSRNVPSFTLLHAEPGGKGVLTNSIVPAAKLSADDISAQHTK